MNNMPEIVELISTPALLVDSELKVIAVNEAARASFSDIKQGMLLSDTCHSDLWEAALRYMRRGKQTYMGLRDAIGTYSMQMLPLAGEGHAALALLSRGIFGDDTIMRAAEAIKEPLLTIRNLVDLINRSPEVLYKDDLSIVDMLRRNISRSLRMLGHVSFIMKPEFTEFSELGPCDLSAAVDTVTKAISLTIAGSDLKMITETGRGLYITGNPEYLERATMCLIANALKYAKSRVTVRTYKREDMACLSVTDDGPGIPPEEKPFIFAPWFTQGTDEGAEVALDLAVAKSIVNGFQGDISLESGDDETTFYVKFPIYTGSKLSSPLQIVRASAEYSYSVEAADVLQERKSKSSYT